MSLFNLSGVISMVGTHDVTVKRPNAQTWADGGFASAQTFTTFTVPKCPVHPGKSKDLEHAPEGTRAHQLVVIFATVELREADRVTVPGRGDYQVINADPWDESGGFCRVVALALNSSEPRP